MEEVVVISDGGDAWASGAAILAEEVSPAMTPLPEGGQQPAPRPDRPEESPAWPGASPPVQGAPEALLRELAQLRQENERLRQQLDEARDAVLAGERWEMGSGLLHYVLEVLCTLLRPQRGHTIVAEAAGGAGASPVGIGPVQSTLERSSLARALGGQAAHLTTRYESVLWLPIRQGTETAMVLCLRRGPADPFTGTERATGAALAPLVISALQAGRSCFDLAADPQALATVGGTLVACIRGGGGRVAALTRDAEWLAQWLQLGAAERAAVRLAAILHDIGTVDLAEGLLRHEERLSRAELAQVREHPSFGAAIVQQVAGLEAVASLVLAHQERWDGAGYPHGLAGEAIPLGARVIAVVDAFHAMTRPRAGGRARTPEAARAALRAGAGAQFDPRVVAAFLALERAAFPGA